MATYLPGVTGYIPQIQEFRPDFNYYNGALQFKQSKYDSAHERLSTMYGSLLNAPMLRDKNIEARDQFFKAIDQDIQKMSGMDLSLQQNEASAEAIFDQITDNKNIVKDMVWTKSWQDEQRRAEGFRNCIDPAKCGGSWWEGGVRALNYQAEEFRNATDNEALMMGESRFTPYQNMMEDAIKLAKESGLSIKVDQLQGGYITTTKNGPQLVGPLSSLFMGKFANDPKYADYYKTKAYVDRKDWVSSNAPVYGSVEAAESAYLNEVTNLFTSQMGTAEKELESEYNHTQGQRRQLEERIRTEGALPGSPLARQYNEMNQFEQEIKDSYDVVQGANKTMSLAMDGAGNPRAAMSHIDNAVAMMTMGQDINAAAQTLAYRDYEFSMKADEYSLEGYRQSNRMALESVKQQNRIELQAFKASLTEQKQEQQAMGSDIDNVPELVKDVIGATAIGDQNNLLDNLLGDQGGYQQFVENRREIQNDVVGNEKGILQEVINLSLSKSRSENGAGMASRDLIKMGDYMFNQLARQESFEDVDLKMTPNAVKNRNNAQKYYQNNARYYNSLSDAEKLHFMQRYDFNKILNSKALPNQVYSNLYSNIISPIIDQKNEGNRVNRDYLGNLWERTADQRNQIKSKEKSLDKLDQWYASTAQDVANELRISNPQYAGFIDHYIDPKNGRIRSEHEFADSYARSQIGGGRFEDPRNKENPYYQRFYQQAKGLYRGDKMTGGFLGIGEEVSQGIHDVWKRAWSKYAKPEGGYHFLGVNGTGSKEVNGIGFASVDPSKYKSSGTMNTLSFMKDVLRSGSDGSKIAFGKATGSVPSNNTTAQKIFGQLFNDMLSQNDAKDQKRPMLSVTYQDIAGGNDKWTALNIKVTNENYLRKYIGSEKNPGLMREQKDLLMNQGITVYLNKDKATNGFRMASKNTDIDRVLGYTGEYDFDSYPEFTQSLKLKKLPNGGYEVNGSIMAGLNEDGTPNWQPHYNPYHSPLTDPNQIVKDYQSLLQEISLGNATMLKQQTMSNGIKDPSQL